MSRLFLILVLAAAAGCGDTEDPTAPTAGNNGNNGANNGGNNGVAEAAVTYHRDIAPLLEANCTTCHRDGGIAPFVLTDYTSVNALKMAISESVHTRTMPPWLAGPDCATYVNDPSLAPEELALIDEWIALGAPEGDPATAPATERTVEEGLSRVDATISMPEVYTPQYEPDDYRCFLIEWPEDQTKYVTGFRAIPGNDAVVHHVIAFIGTPDTAEQYRRLDAAEAGPGYTCYGGPGNNRANWLGSWAPGSNAGDFYPGTGIKIEPGSVIIMQVHYNTLNSGSIEDLTAIDLRLDDAVDKEAFVMPFTNPSWLDDGGMPIAKGDDDATHRFAFDPSRYLGYITNNTIEGGEFVIYGLGIHMHTLGTKGRIAIERTGGTQECMLDVPRWDFGWQLAYGFESPKVFKPGDRISLECHWDNTAGNQVYSHVDTDGDGQTDAYQQLEPGDVQWGEGTQDEMCLGIMYITSP